MYVSIATNNTCMLQVASIAGYNAKHIGRYMKFRKYLPPAGL